MKLISRLLIALVLAVLILPQATSAAMPRSGNLLTVDAGQTVTDDVYMAGKEVKIDGTVRGDLIVASESVLITGQVTGDVWMVGARLEIKGTVSGTVHFGGAELDITGQVGEDVTAAARDIHISGPVGRDVWVAGNGAVLTGTIGRDVKTAANQVTLAGTTNGSVDAEVGRDLKLESTAVIGGNLTYHSQSAFSPQAGAVVRGQTTFDQTQKSDRHDGFTDRLRGNAYWLIASLLLLVGILLYARRAAVAGAELIRKRPGVSLLTGVAFVVLTPLAMIFLALLVFGLPLAFFTAIGYVLVIYTAKVFPALLVGTLITRHKADSFWPAAGAGALGLIIYYVLQSIPILGFLLMIATVCFGAGAQVLLLHQVYKDNRKKYGV
jgi:cytoskeletal protein CcmA (bactofilin family)